MSTATHEESDAGKERWPQSSRAFQAESTEHESNVVNQPPSKLGCGWRRKEIAAIRDAECRREDRCTMTGIRHCLHVLVED
jgi:hypothetical protein